MASEPTLEGLPADILELIACMLPRKDLCSLRMVSKDLASRLARGRFKTYFFHKRLGFTQMDLERFPDMTQSESLGCHLRDLTIVGGVDTDVNDDAELLARAVTNLRMRPGRGCLDSLSLQMPSEDSDVDVRRTDWQRRWAAANAVYQGVMMALRESELKVLLLNVFGDARHCSLSIDQLEELSLPCFNNLKGLKLSLTHTLSHGIEATEDQAVDDGLDLAHGVPALLGACPHLEDLDLHWYDNVMGRRHTPAEVEQKHFLNHLTCSCPKLNTLSLRGVPCKGDVLLRFLEASPGLKSITLENLNMKGSFRPIFSLLNTTKTLYHIHLDDLYEDDEKGSKLHFDGPGKPHYRTAARLVRPYHLTRDGDECRRPIVYRTYSGRAKASAALFRWRDRQHEIYGPPSGMWRIGAWA